MTLDHEPLADVEIVFLPDPAAGNKGPRSSAYTDKQGRYRLRTDKGIDGAAVGPCFVCVNDLRVVPGVAGADASGTGGSRPPGGPGGAGGSRVPLRYNRPTETPWRIDVSPGGPHTHNFNVEGGRAK